VTKRKWSIISLFLQSFSGVFGVISPDRPPVPNNILGNLNKIHWSFIIDEWKSKSGYFGCTQILCCCLQQLGSPMKLIANWCWGCDTPRAQQVYGNPPKIEILVFKRWWCFQFVTLKCAHVGEDNLLIFNSTYDRMEHIFRVIRPSSTKVSSFFSVSLSISPNPQIRIFIFLIGSQVIRIL
jgi:hypothetical protein